MQKQAQINEEMRAHLVDWLVKVHHNFHCVQETLYLAINLIDRFLELKNAQRSEFQLIGVAAFMVAVKYEETSSSSSLDPRDLVQLMEGRHSLKDLVSMEFNILSVLDFKITIATAHSFLVQYSNAANANLDMVKIASFLTERVLQEFTMVQYLPSMVASCAIYLARLHLNLDPWSSNLLKFTGYTEKNLLSCYNQMLVILKTKTTLTAVELKYDLETCRAPEKS
jgi:cyclin B